MLAVQAKPLLINSVDTRNRRLVYTGLPATTQDAAMIPLTVFRPDDVLNQGDNPADLSSPRYRFLAQGDSWFSIGDLNLAKNSNLLFEMAFANSRCAVNCARAGSTLRRMVDQVHEHTFHALLCGAQWRPWDGILLSAGGNDLIEALGHTGIADPALRLFLKPAELTGDPSQAASYVSAAGWATFETYLRANFATLMAMRDLRMLNHNIPVFVHTYHYPTIRNAPAGPGLGPWLFKAAVDFAIPQNLWPAVTKTIYDQFADLLIAIALGHSNMHVFDTARQVSIVPAAPDTRHESGDWMNEIHLTWQGYEKLAVAWAASIATQLP
jgi:lysophospholipase L1-like esterase